ncbi:hypothetical protein NOV72_05232 [Caballeronia novacaledonica]|uniref:Lipoprotein n=1 Tax=Caballeronia novacaledonica TaxID=1544861 RepID=A0A2U3ICU2_9BURK|nr:hypothetical protein [Caballeronia novacaledonica]SPB18033.1 hypothetical protein NOV72_05232 [Caballeronia novacaledonica]
MQRPFASKARIALIVCMAASMNASAAPRDSSFESVFSVKGEPASLYYKVRFVANDGPHTMQIWRDGQTRLRRRTDDALDTYVIRDAADPGEFQMIVVDYGKRITTRIDRNNLVRLGRFIDWFDLAHGLRHPVGEYRIADASAPPKLDAPVTQCRWYEIRQGDAAHRVCWSQSERLPIVIWSASRGEVWRVTAVDRRSIAPDTFRLNDAGFVRNDANADIDSD